MIDTTNGCVDTLTLALPMWVPDMTRDRILEARDTLLRWIEASEAEEHAAHVALMEAIADGKRLSKYGIEVTGD